jgi:(p)ppGpp synthase/HD superfamily hydrolase
VLDAGVAFAYISIVEENLDQLKMITRSWLSGAGMTQALKAVNLGLQWHDGTQKDGTTPEFVHQLSQIQEVRGLAGISLSCLEIVICTIALHDLPEDKRYDIRWVYNDFGGTIGIAVEKMSKKYFGEDTEQSAERYYFDIGEDRFASLAKGCDRVHNHASMPGVFAPVKMMSYMDETEEYVLPMLKRARKNFPEQEVAYTTLRHRLREQMFLIRTCYQIGHSQDDQSPGSSRERISTAMAEEMSL